MTSYYKLKCCTKVAISRKREASTTVEPLEGKREQFGTGQTGGMVPKHLDNRGSNADLARCKAVVLLTSLKVIKAELRG